MKNIKFVVVAILMAVTTSAFAQFGHNSFYVQYNSLGVGEYAEVLEDMDADSEKLTGLTMGFNKAFPVSSSIPLFVEVGAGLTYAWAKIYDEEETDDCPFGCGDEFSIAVKISSQHVMVNVPVNVMYKFQIPNSSIVLEPYVGLNAKAHILGQMKMKVPYDACCDDMEDAFDEVMDEFDEVMDEFDLDDMTVNYFDKDNMGGKKYVATRLNIGWQIGANFDFGRTFVGVSYGSDFGKFMKDDNEEWKFNATNVTVGFRF